MSVSSRSTDTKTIDSKFTDSSTPVVQTTGTAQACHVISPARTDITVTQVSISTTNSRSIAQPNGPVATSAPPNRASPIPNQANLPNGKPASPLVTTSNTMPNGGGPQTVTSKDPKAAAQAASDMRNIVRRKLTGYVGFANLPNQWHRKSVRKGFNFNVMVVGELWTGYVIHSEADQMQVNLVLASPLLSTLCSTPRSIHQKSASNLLSTLHQRPSAYKPSPPISRRTACAFV